MATPNRFYYHDIGPYAYEWNGIPRPPSRAGASTSLTGLGEISNTKVGIAVAILALIWWSQGH
jgi:hypothetical protein